MKITKLSLILVFLLSFAYPANAATLDLVRSTVEYTDNVDQGGILEFVWNTPSLSNEEVRYLIKDIPSDFDVSESSVQISSNMGTFDKTIKSYKIALRSTTELNGNLEVKINISVPSDCPENTYTLKLAEMVGSDSDMLNPSSINITVQKSSSNPPSITALYPNGGESIPIGTQVQVSAHATDDTAVTSVTFSYSNNSGSDWNPIGAGTRVSGTAKDGIWNRTWNTNNLGAGSNYLIKAVASDGTSTRDDRSDSTFSLTCTPPSAPTLNDPGTTDTDGSYTVSWSSVSGATNYTLEEDTSGSFGSPTVVYSGSGTSKYITGRSDGTYYYRVKACNACGCGGWSDVEDIEVEISCMFMYEITASADDGYSSPQGYYNSTLNLTMVGTFGDEVYFNGWHRFQNVTIPEGGNITRAFVTLTAYSNIYTTVPDDTLKTVIRAEYAANPLPPSSASDHAGRTRTPHSVEWNITEWEAGEIYSSPDISDIIQGLVNVHDYSSGAAIQIFHDATDDVPSVLYQPEAASGEGYITACTYDHSPLDAARLYIEYTVTSLRGDLNSDGILTPADAAIALHLAASGGWDANADVNHDSHITSLDALMILQAGGGRIKL